MSGQTEMFDDVFNLFSDEADDPERLRLEAEARAEAERLKLDQQTTMFD
jgi:hypothetical protein